MKQPQRTMPVHALDDKRVHLALPHHGLLRQGRLKTLCGLQAVSELSSSPQSSRSAAAAFASARSMSTVRDGEGQVKSPGDLSRAEATLGNRNGGRDRD